jgi:hypothetical protein
MLGGFGKEVRDPPMIVGALQRVRASVLQSRKSAVTSTWIDPGGMH